MATFDPPQLSSRAQDADATIRELRIRVGLLQSEIEQLRHEHAALRASIANDVAVLARRYLEPTRSATASTRGLDGVVFGGWDRSDGERASVPADDPRDSRRA